MPDLLTLDANPIVDLIEDRPGAPEVREILDLGLAGEVDLAVSRVITDDLLERTDYGDALRALRVLDVDLVGRPFRLDGSPLGGDDRLGSAAFLALPAELAVSVEWAVERRNLGRLPGAVDFDHLHAHYLHRRDFFITRDKPILRWTRAAMEPRFGVRAVCPETYLARRSGADRA